MALFLVHRRDLRLCDVPRVVSWWVMRVGVGALLFGIALSSWGQTCTGVTYQPSATYGTVSRQASAPMWFSSASTANSNTARLAFWMEFGVEFAMLRFPSTSTVGGGTCYKDQAAPGLNASGNGIYQAVRGRWSTTTNSCGEFNATATVESLQIQGNLVDGQCEPDGGCDAEHENVGKRFTSVSPMAGCDASSQCKVEQSGEICFGGFDGASGCSRQYVVTSEDCDSGEDEGEVPPPGEACGTSDAGNEFCMSKDGDNCGWFNDEFVCFDQIEDDGCQAFGDGGRMCGSDAPTPPVPDNGTPGQAAQPDDTVTTTNNEYNYYNNTTVSGSGRPVGTGDNPYEDGDDGSGVKQPGSADGGSSGEGLMCDPSSDAGCSEEGEGGAAEDDPRAGWQCWSEGDLSASVGLCFAEATQTLWNVMTVDSSLVQVANATAAAWPSGGGACPSDVVNIGWLGQSFDFWEVPCTFLDDVEALLGPMFLLGWSLIGLRILLTIPGGE